MTLWTDWVSGWRAIFAALVAWLCGLLSFGCAAPGWEPGPRDRFSEVDVPVLGKVTLGEANRTLMIRGLKGDGQHYPSADEIMYTSDPAIVLATRGEQQRAVEGQRMEYAIIALQTAAQELRATAAALAPIISGMSTQRFEQGRAGAADSAAREQALLDRLERLLNR